jgi:hypothetical protein
LDKKALGRKENLNVDSFKVHVLHTLMGVEPTGPPRRPSRFRIGNAIVYRAVSNQMLATLFVLDEVGRLVAKLGLQVLAPHLERLEHMAVRVDDAHRYRSFASRGHG